MRDSYAMVKILILVSTSANDFWYRYR